MSKVFILVGIVFHKPQIKMHQKSSKNELSMVSKRIQKCRRPLRQQLLRRLGDYSGKIYISYAIFGLGD